MAVSEWLHKLGPWRVWRQSKRQPQTAPPAAPPESPPTFWSSHSGDSFARMVRDRLHDVEGLRISVRKINPAVATPASYLVDISFPSDVGVLCEVADSLHDVRIMDPDGGDVTVEEALTYVRNRADGMSPTDAWRGL